MSFLDRSKLDAAKVAFDTRFQQALASLAQANPWVRSLVTQIDLSAPTVEFNWMGFPGAVKEWNGERKLEKLRAYNYRIASKDWEDSLQVDENDIKDDRLGLYQPRIDMLAQAFLAHQESLFVAFLVNGFAATAYGNGYDNVPFFGASHPLEKGGPNDNHLHATLDDAGAFAKAFELARELKRDDGEPLGVTPSHLLVGPDYEETARQIVLAERLASGASNTNYRRVELQVTPHIAGNHWFLLDLTKPVRPLFYAEREAVWSDSVVSGERQFMSRQLLFGAAARYNAAYAYYQLAIGSDGTT